VNLAAGQLLQPGIVDQVADILRETGFPADRLFLEVTESALVNFEAASRALHGLRGLGIGLALDDFGTGYSALSYLDKLPFDIVKVDRSFIASIGKGKRVDALLEGIVGLSRALELVTVAEGVESEEQLERVTALGFDVAQGFLFARPMPDAAFAAMFAMADSGSAVRADIGALHGLGARAGTSAAG
jgi:EAL domain-containing protein (putative c-di-GMP-specific phosphodiesterase class I)